jgi:phage-related protein
MANGGDVIFNFKGDNKELNNSIKNATNALKSIGKTSIKAMGVATGAVSAAFVGMVTSSVKARGEIEQQIGGTEAVFGKYSKNIQEMAKKSYKSMGTSANDYMATINKMGSLMKGSGITNKKAMDLSSKAMQRAADVASVMGISIESAMESIAGAAKGNFTMMDNLGVAMNATTLEAYGLQKGLKKTYKEMSNAEKIQLAMEMFLEKSAFAAGNYRKENDTLAGSISTLKAAWSNFLSGAGDLGQVVEAVTGAVNIIIKTVSEAIPSIINNFILYLPQLMETGKILINSLISGITQNIPFLTETTVTIIQTIVDWITQNLSQIMNSGIEITISLINGISEIIPDLIPKAAEAVTTFAEALVDNSDKIIDSSTKLMEALGDGLIKSIPKITEKAPTIIGKLVLAIVKNYPKVQGAGLSLIFKFILGIVTAVPKLTEKIATIIANVIKQFISSVPKFAMAGKNIVEGIWAGIGDKAQWLFEKIKGFKDAVLNKFKSFFGIHSPSTLFRDELGVFMAQGIGEGFTDEMSSVSKQMNKAMATVGFGDMFELSPTLNRTMSSSSNVNVQVINNMETDLLGNLVNNIKTYSNGAKNDYNYGMSY